MSPIMRFRKIFPRDTTSSVVQKDLNTRLRIGIIRGVDAERGVCTIEWVDKPGMRTDVLLTQSHPKEFIIPEKDSYAIIGFDVKDQARILRYINLGQESRIKNSHTLPKLQPGEKYWECGGSYLRLKRNGDVLITTQTEGYLLLENSSNTLKSETVNWQVISDGGQLYTGVIKRFITGVDGSKSQVMIENILGETLTELKLKIFETSDNQVGISSSTDPFAEIVIGTDVNNDGKILDRKREENNFGYTKEVGVRVTLKNGVEFTIDKEGVVNFSAKKVIFNNAQLDTSDLDVLKNLQLPSTQGTKGQHIAREHDKVTIPLSSIYIDNEHLGLASKASTNQSALLALKSYIMSGVPIPNNTALVGEVTEGAVNLLAGDE